MEKKCCCKKTAVDEIDLSKYCYRRRKCILLDNDPCWLYYWHAGCAKHLEEHKECIGNYHSNDNKVNGYDKLLTYIFENYQPAPILHKENRKNKRYLYSLLKILFETKGKISISSMYQTEAIDYAAHQIQSLFSPQKFSVLVTLGLPVFAEFVMEYCKEDYLQSLITISKTNDKDKIFSFFTLEMIKFMEILYEIFPYDILTLIISCFSFYEPFDISPVSYYFQRIGINGRESLLID